jgi:hypothetical protein
LFRVGLFEGVIGNGSGKRREKDRMEMMGSGRVESLLRGVGKGLKCKEGGLESRKLGDRLIAGRGCKRCRERD